MTGDAAVIDLAEVREAVTVVCRCWDGGPVTRTDVVDAIRILTTCQRIVGGRCGQAIGVLLNSRATGAATSAAIATLRQLWSIPDLDTTCKGEALRLFDC